jgi:hypothetical protein
MIRTDAPQRFSIRSELEWKPPWWLLFAWLAWLWVSVLLAAIVRGYEPPAGWVGAIAGTLVVALLFGFVFWLTRMISDQYLIVRPDGLLFAIPFRKLIPFADIERVTRADALEPPSEDRLIQGLSNFFNRRLVSTRDHPPNIEIDLRRAVRLNLYPFRWFRQLVLALDTPPAFLSALPNEVMIYVERGGEDPPIKDEPFGIQEKVILLVVLTILAAASVHWIGWGWE